MSTKVWALNKDTGKIQNVADVDKSFQGRMVCIDGNCREELIICKGEKNKPYFAHKSNTSCRGGTKVEILKLLCTQVISECEVFTLPDEFTLFKNERVVFKGTRDVLISKCDLYEDLTPNFRTGIKLTDMIGEVFYVELYNGTFPLSRRREYIRNQCSVVGIDVSKFTEDIDSVSLEDITNFSCRTNEFKSYLTSPSIEAVNSEIGKSIFKASGDKIACPARGYEVIVERKSCKSCPFFFKVDTSDKSVICYGKGLYANACDFSNISKEAVRRDKYSRILPRPLWGVDKSVYANYFGTCPECGGYNIIGRGKKGTKLEGVAVVDEPDGYVYKVCRDCGHHELIHCPSCHRPMTLRENRKTGSIFAGCTGYSSTSTIGGYVCKTCISLFEFEPCMDNIHEDIKAVGSLDAFLEDIDKARAKAKRARNKVRKE